MEETPRASPFGINAAEHHPHFRGAQHVLGMGGNGSDELPFGGRCMGSSGLCSRGPGWLGRGRVAPPRGSTQSIQTRGWLDVAV